MRYLSVCSGIEAATVAWHHMGWVPAAFSEIEPFPSAVLKHHYPEVPNLGDMTRFKEWNLGPEPIGLLVGGTPCQAFSVAGLRGGLSDARGNLSLTFCEMADHFDPEWVLWENVPGVLSSKDNAFGCFLAGLSGASEPLVSERGWDNAGLVVGPKRTVAWRILDAQYHGVAQRRRRVFVLAVRGAGNWASASALFPLGTGMYWDCPPSRPSRKGAAGSVAPSVAGSLDTQCGGGKLTHQSVANGHVIGTITARMFNALGARDVEEGALLPVAQPLAFKVRGGVEVDSAGNTAGNGFLGSEDTAFTLAATQDQWLAEPVAGTLGNRGLRSHTELDGHGAYIPVAYALQHAQIGRKDEAGPQGKGWQEEVAFTQDSRSCADAVAFGVGEQPDVGHCLRSGASKADKHESTTYVAQPLAFHNRQDPDVSGDITHPIGAKDNGMAVAFGGDVARSLTARHDSSPCADRGMDVVATAMQVRRLTPVECERLQGFPDNYTNIPWRNKPEAPDGPRYKALGNSMAVPVMRWIGERIATTHKM